MAQFKIDIGKELYDRVQEYCKSHEGSSQRDAITALFSQKGEGQAVTKEVIKEIPVEKIIYRDREVSPSSKIYACYVCNEEFRDKQQCNDHVSLHTIAHTPEQRPQVYHNPSEYLTTEKCSYPMTVEELKKICRLSDVEIDACLCPKCNRHYYPTMIKEHLGMCEALQKHEADDPNIRAYEKRIEAGGTR